jgi:hypothetical protein
MLPGAQLLRCQSTMRLSYALGEKGAGGLNRAVKQFRHKIRL